jgi:hypothetical protein
MRKALIIVGLILGCHIDYCVTVYNEKALNPF